MHVRVLNVSKMLPLTDYRGLLAASLKPTEREEKSQVTYVTTQKVPAPKQWQGTSRQGECQGGPCTVHTSDERTKSSLFDASSL